MKFVKEKMVFNGFKTNKVEDKEYHSLYFIDDEANNEALNYVGNVEELSSLKPGDFIDLHCKVYKSKDNYYKIVGISVYKIELSL